MPDICLSTLNGDPRSRGGNLEGLKMEFAHGPVNTLLKQATNPKLKTRYFSCPENYNDVVDDLKGFPSILKFKEYTG
ncbi:hypothetical protein R3W88_008230 [Solanum pinnatisectum]|uniref:Uncharacterized protein n=1 Tax=Solanum pinnatisectum TaxID=50273 RepID=A0AAV9MAK9_9SOLN|nr:hypothetical protein R3W88_008230 [Solanum pinnatisectum]